MKRRTVLRTAPAAAGVLGLAGCLDLGGDGDGASDERVEELESELADAEAEAESLREERDALETRVENLEDKSDTLRRERVGELYYLADDQRSLASEFYDSGNQAGGDDEWNQAARLLSSSMAYYDGAAQLIGRVDELCDEFDYAEAGDAAGNSRQYVVAMRSATEAYAGAAERYARGENGAGDQFQSRGNRHVAEATDLGFLPPEQFGELLWV